MLSRKKRFRSSSGVIKPGNRLLRLLRSDTGFQASLISQERTDQEDAHTAHTQKDIRNAMLEAEYKKAKAIMMMQQHRTLY